MRRATWRLALSVLLAAPAPAMAAPWWYVDHDTHTVLFIDAGSIARDGDIVAYAAKTLLHNDADPVSMTQMFMRVDCRKGLLGIRGIQRYGHDDRVIDTSTGGEDMGPTGDALATSALRFACSDDAARAARGQFVLAVDDRAFSDALIGGGSAVSPRALQDALLASSYVTIIRSSAADPETFGRTQTVRKGLPIVPPRDYAKGPQIPVAAEHSANEVGRIYDITYQGIEQGALQFEVRGYAIDDLAHPGSGQIETVPRSAKNAKIRDIAITIKAATPDSLTYSVAIEKDISH